MDMNAHSTDFLEEYTPMINRMNGFVDIRTDYQGWIALNDSNEYDAFDDSDEADDELFGNPFLKIL